MTRAEARPYCVCGDAECDGAACLGDAEVDRRLREEAAADLPFEVEP